MIKSFQKTRYRGKLPQLHIDKKLHANMILNGRECSSPKIENKVGIFPFTTSNILLDILDKSIREENQIKGKLGRKKIQFSHLQMT